MSTTPIRRALISVSDKTGLVDLARALHRAGVEILSTGGTARALDAEDIPVTQVSDHTGFPEIMGGRIKTLHPRIHGGILARRGTDEAVMDEHGIAPVDLVVVNLYPFAEAVADPECSLEHGIENIDIGGPAMVRAAAKNQQHVAVVTDPDDYADVSAEIAGGGTSERTRRRLALKAFRHTAAYDAAIADWLGREENAADSLLPAVFQPRFERMQELVDDGTIQYDAYLVDEDQSVAAAYGAVCTPDPFLFGKADGEFGLPDDDYSLETGDRVVVLTDHEHLADVVEADELVEDRTVVAACRDEDVDVTDRLATAPDRTCDLDAASVALSQLSYIPKC